MPWSHGVAYGFGGLFLANAIPHWVSGVMGRPFQSPFAKPRGEGLSSSTVNVLWGAFNASVGYLLLFHVGAFEPRDLGHVALAGLPAVAGSVWLARRFGRFNGGNEPPRGTPST
ncbi:membrane protein [Cystobacter fuscus]|uniref:Membrane protein n=1 Tax=Cystobacter fuscus TaxID=43 RepID=A0A250IZJ0_9BACT|nr:hypothetical protein [Cystobacter fuscus]ATB37149.1 membrane protein [Cystobacter fuscus]